MRDFKKQIETEIATYIAEPDISEIRDALLESTNGVEEELLPEFIADCEIEGFRYALSCADEIADDCEDSARIQVDENFKSLVRGNLDTAHQKFYIYEGSLLREYLEHFFDDGNEVHFEKVIEAQEIHERIYQRLDHLGVNVDCASISTHFDNKITCGDYSTFAKVEDAAEQSESYKLVQQAADLFHKMISEL
tara:strand:+ start:382 stop:960 length:579 start_codon:yes stop_codon:yes gene_type:complete